MSSPSWVYKRAPANMGFIRTGWGGTKVCLGRGAIVLPVFHEVSWISLETMKLVVNRSREQAVLTADKIRVDVVAEMYTHVGHTEDSLLVASRSLGEKTFEADAVRSLLEAKVVGAIRSYGRDQDAVRVARGPQWLRPRHRRGSGPELQGQRAGAGGSDHRVAGAVVQGVLLNANNIFDAKVGSEDHHRDHLGRQAQGPRHRKADHRRDPPEGSGHSTGASGDRA